MVNEFQKMINLLNIVDEQHRLEGEDERDYCRSIICEVIKMLKKCEQTTVGGSLPHSCVDPLFEIKGCDMPKGSCSACGGNDR